MAIDNFKVVKPEENKVQNNDHAISHQIIAGALGGCATRFFCQPLDVLKIRFQIQIEPVKKSSKSSVYKGMVQAFSHIVQSEGLTALWKGHVAAQALSVTFGMFQFATFDIFASHAMQRIPGSETIQPIINFAAGLGAGCLATIASFPFDTVRTRLVVQGEPKVYSGIGNVMHTMYTQEGFFSLYRGLWPTLLQIGPYVGCQFALYKFCVGLYDEYFGKSDHIGIRSLVCGAISGAVAKTVIYPLDLGKKRLQVQGFSQRHNYKGLWDCLLITARNEGISAWVKGLSPSLVKALVSSALHFYFYEICLQFLSR